MDYSQLVDLSPDGIIVSRNDSILDSPGGNHRSIDVH